MRDKIGKILKITLTVFGVLLAWYVIFTLRKTF